MASRPRGMPTPSPIARALLEDVVEVMLDDGGADRGVAATSGVLATGVDSGSTFTPAAAEVAWTWAWTSPDGRECAAVSMHIYI